jgi:hypothetical protein
MISVIISDIRTEFVLVLYKIFLFYERLHSAPLKLFSVIFIICVINTILGIGHKYFFRLMLL